MNTNDLNKIAELLFTLTYNEPPFSPRREEIIKYTAMLHVEAMGRIEVVDEIAIERRRQIHAEGWTPEHDDEHKDCELARAAASYVLYAANKPKASGNIWPWEDTTGFKPKNARRNLIRAAALIVAEIERLDRARPRESQVRSGCAVRAAIQADFKKEMQGDWNAPAMEEMRRQFMAALDFTIKISESGDSHGAIDFLRGWREGDVSQWPEFKGPVPW